MKAGAFEHRGKAMNQPNAEYQAYLLRLLPTHHNDTVSWRASLQEVESGERLGFEDLDMLFAYIRQQTTAKESADG